MMHKASMIGLALVIGACAGTYHEYPTAEVKDLDQHIDFKTLRATPTAYQGQVIHLAGEILQTESVGDNTVIWAQRKRLRKHPEYPGFRPDEIGEDPAEHFVLAYRGPIDSQGLRIGNKFISVAELVPVRPNHGNQKGASQSDRLSFRPHCLHIWKTGHKKISAFPDRYNQVYAPLEQDTYCDPTWSLPRR